MHLVFVSCKAFVAAKPPERSKWALGSVWPRSGVRIGCSSPLGYAVAVELAARARFGFAEALDLTTRARSVSVARMN